jgi:hypothetical protein
MSLYLDIKTFEEELDIAAQEALNRLRESKNLSIDVRPLTNIIKKKINKYPDQLISRILIHFHSNDTMTEEEFNKIKKIPTHNKTHGFSTKFYGGNHGAVHSLQNLSNPWLKKAQRKYGSIVRECSHNIITIEPLWKEALYNIKL